jgi:aminoglycoside phosphotransferase family enzyme/predicted kinase
MAGSPQGPATQAQLVEALRQAAASSAPSPPRVLETHISYVLLTGTHAYKIKKAVRLAFLDYSTLASRRHYCELELQLNRRLAPSVYLDVAAITGTPDRPSLGGEGPVIEYAVRMREFRQEALLSHMLTEGSLRPEHIDDLAARVAAFHRAVSVAPPHGQFGIPEDVFTLAISNFAEARALFATPSDVEALDALQDWTEHEFEVRAGSLQRRRRDGFVRECHGDLHLGNIALVDGELTVFDCIEFNDEMRWVDVLSEAAFTAMDLHDRGRSDFAFRFLSAYLEHTGDYGGLDLLRFYLVYRAMVRAKVAAIRRKQSTERPAEDVLLDESRAYLRLATRLAGSSRPALVIMNGPSGSGKSTCAERLVERVGAIRIRTDVERKRLHGLEPGASSSSTLEGGLYGPIETERTYQAVRRAARCAVLAGFTAIVDGSFLKRRHRELLREIGNTLRVPFLIVACTGQPATLRARVAERLRGGTDASEAGLAVLERQLSTLEPLEADEIPSSVTWYADAPAAAMEDEIVHMVNQRLRHKSFA